MGSGKPIAVILIVFAGFLAVFIFLQGAGIYHSVKTGSNAVAANSRQDCFDYIFGVRGMYVEGNTLSFLLENRNYGKAAMNQVVVATGAETQELAVTLVPGQERAVSANWSGGTAFLLYVPGCRTYALNCSIAEGVCR